MADPRCPELALRPRRRGRAAVPVVAGQYAFRFRPPAPDTAESAVRSHLLAVLPPGIPPSFARIEAAEFQGRGRSRTAVAKLTMCDGLAATVEVFSWGHGCAGHRWLAWEGAPLFAEWLRKNGWLKGKKA